MANEEMKDEIHPGIEQISNFVNIVNTESVLSLYEKGYIYLNNLIKIEELN